MSFTHATITHSFENADGTPASGAITFTLTKRMTNGALTIVPAEITASLSPEGKISQTLTSNKDAGTVPEDTEWRVDFRVLGAPTETFFITVPSGGGEHDLGSLLPNQPIGG